MTDEAQHCLNCKAILNGPFCGQCGQNAQTSQLAPIKVWLNDFVGSFVKLDSKLLLTLKRIFFQPGQATLDFAGGRRAPYAGPAKVYIIVSAISIAIMTIQGFFSPDALPGIEVDENFSKRLRLIFPFVNLLSPFFTAGLLALMYRHIYFQVHLAFSLHYWTLLIAICTPLAVLNPTSLFAIVGFAIAVVVVVVYLFFAHRKVYPSPLFQQLAYCSLILGSVLLANLVLTMLLVGLVWITG